MFSVQNFLYRGLIFLLVFTLAYVFTEWRFSEWMPTVFFGDDLANILSYKAGNFPNTLSELLSNADGGKFRPVFIGVLGFLFYLFDINIHYYLVTNVILNSLNACFIFAIANKLAKGQVLVSTSIALVVATSRFSLYQTSQVTGVLEGLGFAFFLMTIYCIVKSRDSKEKNAFLWALAGAMFSVITLHTHERYIGLVFWLAFVIAILPMNCCLSKIQKIALSSMLIATIAFNIIYKQYVLQVSFLTGTGGQKIGIDISQITNHILQAVLSVFGFNEGPDYLVGSRALSSESWPAALLGGMFLSGYIIVIGLYLYNILCKKNESLLNKWNSISWIGLFGLLAILLLAPPVMTIRVEQRWLLQPFALLLFSLAWAVRDYSRKPIVTVLSGFILLCLFFADTIICKHFERVYMVYSGRFASLVKKELLDSAKITNGKNILIANKDHMQWTLLNNKFFDLYNTTSTYFDCVDSLSSIENKKYGNDVKYYSTKDDKIIDITSEIKYLTENHKSLRNNFYDFVSKFDNGVINNPVKVSSPNGQGVFKLPVSFLTGNLEALFAVSGFECKFENIQIPSGATMEFGLEMYYPSAYPLTASIVIKDTKSHQEVTFTKEIQPRINKDYLTIDPVSIDLSEFSDKTVSIAFSASTKPGDSSSAHWAVFAAPRIVQRSSEPKK